jgi:hypothetical protein
MHRGMALALWLTAAGRHALPHRWQTKGGAVELQGYFAGPLQGVQLTGGISRKGSWREYSSVR